MEDLFHDDALDSVCQWPSDIDVRAHFLEPLQDLPIASTPIDLPQLDASKFLDKKHADERAQLQLFRLEVYHVTNGDPHNLLAKTEAICALFQRLEPFLITLENDNLDIALFNTRLTVGPLWQVFEQIFMYSASVNCSIVQNESLSIFDMHQDFVWEALHIELQWLERLVEDKVQRGLPWDKNDFHITECMSNLTLISACMLLHPNIVEHQKSLMIERTCVVQKVLKSIK